MPHTVSKKPYVTGFDLDDVRQTMGLSTADACWLFAMSISTWSQTVRGTAACPTLPQQQISNPTTALLIRLADAFPNALSIPTMPNVDEFSKLIELVTGEELTKKRLSILLGNEETAAYRWTMRGTRPPDSIKRLMYGLQRLLLSTQDLRERRKLLEQWESIVSIEASSRGVPDVFRTGSWSKTCKRRRMSSVKKAGNESEPSLQQK